MPLVGDGTTDDTIAFRRALSDASFSGRVLKLGPGTYRITDWWALWGFGCLEGESRHSTRILIDVKSPTKYWGHIGARDAAKGQRVAPWFGHIKEVGFIATSENKAQHLIQLHGAANGWSIEDSNFDITAMGHSECNIFSSHIEHVQYPLCQDGTIKNCFCTARNDVIDTGGCGGLNLVLPRRVKVDGNYLYGFADDPLAIIDGECCKVMHNFCTSTRGRLALFGGVACTLFDNNMERIPGTSGNWSNGSDLIAAYVAGVDSRAPTGHKIIDNTAHLPNGPTGYHSLLNCGGVRNSSVKGNILNSDCATASAVYGIRNGTYDFPGWKDPSGVDTDSRSRPRDITFSGNKMTGKRPGTIEEQCPGAPSNMPGPFYYTGNTGKHNIISPNSKVSVV